MTIPVVLRPDGRPTPVGPALPNHGAAWRWVARNRHRLPTGVAIFVTPIHRLALCQACVERN